MCSGPPVDHGDIVRVITGPVRLAATQYRIMPRYDGFTTVFLQVVTTSIRQCTSASFVRDMTDLLRHFFG